MWPYFFMVIILFILQFKFCDKSRENVRFMTGAVLLFLFVALRGVSNGDYTVYLERGRDIDSLYKVFHNNTHMEVGYSMLYYVINLFRLPSQCIIMAMNLISITCITRFIKMYSPNQCLSLLLFLPLYFQFDMHAARTAVAISISALSITYAYRRQFFRFCFTIFLASLFHQVAVIALVVYFVVNIHIDLTIGMGFIFGSMCFIKLVGMDRLILEVFRFAGLNSFYVRYNGYVNSEDFGYPFSLFDPRLWLCILVYIAAKLLCRNATKIENLLINCCLLNALVMILFSEHTFICYRLSAFLNVYSIVLVPVVLKKIYCLRCGRSVNAAIRSYAEVNFLTVLLFTAYAFAYASQGVGGLDYKFFF